MARRTFKQIVAEIQRMPGLGGISVGEIMDKVNTAHKDLGNQPWPWNYAETNVLVPTVYSAGTISITDGTAAVTGAGTAWDPTWTGRRIMFGSSNVDYIVQAITGAGTLTLAQPVNLGTNLVTVPYTMWQDTYTYPSDYLFGSDVALSHPTLRIRIKKITRYKFENIMNAWARGMASNLQMFYCDHDRNPDSGLYRFRLGPPPSSVAEYRLCYHRIAPDVALALVTDFPEGFDEVVTLTAASKLYDVHEKPTESIAVKAIAEAKIRLLKRQVSTQTIDDEPEPGVEVPDSSISQWGMMIQRM